jgi:hypothetical protein
MHAAFDASFQRWKLTCKIEEHLCLKLIVHYGDIIVYDIMGFKKLYGEAVIESHSLLKNGNNETDYILVTEDYLNALHQTVSAPSLLKSGYKTFKSHLTTDLKQIPYYFFPNLKNAASFSTYPV